MARYRENFTLMWLSEPSVLMYYCITVSVMAVKRNTLRCAVASSVYKVRQRSSSARLFTPKFSGTGLNVNHLAGSALAAGAELTPLGTKISFDFNCCRDPDDKILISMRCDFYFGREISK
jgi:hypothetical protein